MHERKKLGYPQWKWICRGISLFAAVLLLANYYKRGVPFAIGLVLLVVALIVAVITLRCPYCGRKLGDPPFLKLKKCPHCGKDLFGKECAEESQPPNNRPGPSAR